MKIFQTNDRRIKTLRILLLALSVLAVAFIFSNSLKRASVSSEESSQVVKIIQEVVGAIHPESPIATATGDDYVKLHQFVRKLAHFTEFALVGTLFCWTYFSYFKEKKGTFIPALGVFAVACTDELLQFLSPGRGPSVVDVCIDCFGGAFGVAFGFLLIWLLERMIRKRKKI